MNAATTPPRFVPLSQSLGAGTVGQDRLHGTSRGTSDGTSSLKSLANKVLQRSKVGQALGQPVGQGQKCCPTPSPPVGQKKEAVPPSVPADFSTGLEWIVWPADDADPDFDAKWAAFDLADLGRLYGVRIVASGGRALAIYPSSLEPELVAYAGSLLAEARGYLSVNMDKLPVLSPAEAVATVKSIMRQHKGLRFARGDGDSLWPLYPATWTAGQKTTVQALWLAAGEALDLDDFKEV